MNGESVAQQLLRHALFLWGPGVPNRRGLFASSRNRQGRIESTQERVRANALLGLGADRGSASTTRSALPIVGFTGDGTTDVSKAADPWRSEVHRPTRMKGATVLASVT